MRKKNKSIENNILKSYTQTFSILVEKKDTEKLIPNTMGGIFYPDIK